MSLYRIEWILNNQIEALMIENTQEELGMPKDGVIYVVVSD